ncbi:MAG: LacI family transcriptional regulator [Bacteroidetes bacterium]|nr:MAG: LacI family transcriptional regulator [Bacteroidota bacterium]
MKKKRTRLKDIAEKLGVTPATVSRALRNRIEIGAETREKIQALAREMHYHPNLNASHLRTQRNFTIGVVVPRIVHEYMASILRGILEEAHVHNYQVIISVTDHLYEREVMAIETFSAGFVDGILLCVSNHTRDFSHVEQLKSEGIPFVLFDKDISKVEAPRVIVDDYKGAMMAVEHLIEQGFVHIAHIQDNLVNHSSQKRMKGYYSALKKHGIPKNPDFVVQLDHISIAQSKEATLALLRAYPSIDALFGITDEIAIGAMQAASELGRSIPREFGVVGFSNWQISSVVSPSLTTVAQPGSEMGKTATRLLIQRIEHPDTYGDRFPTKILKTKLLVRESSFREKVVICQE